MGYSAKIVLDSQAIGGTRLTTFEISFPRIVLAEFNTHRMFSRNSASSRAIPIEKMIQRVREDPFIPVYWGKNQKGMQADQELSENERANAIHIWLDKRNHAVNAALGMINIGVHKQIANRLLEPWLWHTVIVTATEWHNFFALRCSKNAQPEIQVIAKMMQQEMRDSTPTDVHFRGWHLPLVSGNDIGKLKQDGFTLDQLKDISVGRCARVSYLTHDGQRDPNADIKLAESLRTNGHMSPFEHVAQAVHPHILSGNFVGWNQYRKFIPDESVYVGE